MPPKKGKKTAPSKAPAKRTTRAAAKKASDDKSAAADGAVKDATIIKPATPPKPATGEKRKRTDGADDEDSSSSGTKKPKLSPKSAERVRVEEYLKIRVKDLGFNVDPVKGHDDNEDEDEPDEHWTSIQRMRQRCDDRLDEIEEAIRTIGRSLKSGLVIPEHKSDETRHEKRQKDKDIKDDQEIDPIAESKTMKVSKTYPDGKKYRSAKKLGDLVKDLERQFGGELAKRRVLNSRDVSLAKYHSESVSKEKDAAAAKGEPTKLTRSLDKQWNKHGLTLRELLDLYNRHGSQAPAPVRDDLIKKCKQYGLSTSGDLWDLEKAILMYELASKQRMYGLPQDAINRVISALGDIQAPVDSEEDDGGDDGDGKGKDTSDGGRKDASASPKGGKPDDAAKDGSKDGSKDGKKDGSKHGKKDDSKDGKKGDKKDGKDDGKKNDKGSGAAKKGRTRATKTKDLILEDTRLIDQKEIVVTEGGQTQRFKQRNVAGAGNRCMWNAIQLLWIGRQRVHGKLAEAYPVNERVSDLWDSVMHAPEGTTNPARQARLTLYTEMQTNSVNDPHGTPLETRVEDRQWGDGDMAQLVADALDIEIFMYSPQYADDGTISWHRYVRGQPQTDPARRIHLANYMHSVHWTALTPIGDEPITLPALEPEHRHPIFGSTIPVPPLTRLQPGDDDNTDLRPQNKHDPVEDGHVADMTEDEEERKEDADGDEEVGDADGDGDGAGDPPLPPPPAAGATVAATLTAARRLSKSSTKSHPSGKEVVEISSDSGSPSPPASQKRARRRARSRSKSKSRSISQPRGVRKNTHTPLPSSKKTQKKKKKKKKAKALRKIFESFFVAMPSPQNMGGAIPSPFPCPAISCA